MNSPHLAPSCNGAVGYTEGFPAFMRNVLAFMVLGLALTGLSAYLVAQLIPIVDGKPNVGGWIFIALLAEFLVIFPIIRRALASRTGTTSAMVGFAVLAVLNGAALASLALKYQAGTMVMAFAAAVCAFDRAVLWRMLIKTNLTGWGKTLLVLLMGLIVMSVLNIFIGSALAATMLAIVTIVLFIRLTDHDMQTLEKMYHQREAASSTRLAVYAVLSLYLNLMNFTLAFLHLLPT